MAEEPASTSVEVTVVTAELLFSAKLIPAELPSPLDVIIGASLTLTMVIVKASS